MADRKPFPDTAIGEYISKVRREKDIKQEDLGEMSGVSKFVISRMESKGVGIQLRTLREIMVALDHDEWDVAWYLNREGAKPFVDRYMPQLSAGGVDTSVVNRLAKENDLLEAHIKELVAENDRLREEAMEIVPDGIEDFMTGIAKNMVEIGLTEEQMVALGQVFTKPEAPKASRTKKVTKKRRAS